MLDNARKKEKDLKISFLPFSAEELQQQVLKLAWIEGQTFRSPYLAQVLVPKKNTDWSSSTPPGSGMGCQEGLGRCRLGSGKSGMRMTGRVAKQTETA